MKQRYATTKQQLSLLLYLFNHEESESTIHYYYVNAYILFPGIPAIQRRIAGSAVHRLSQFIKDRQHSPLSGYNKGIVSLRPTISNVSSSTE
jgi:hypothetical protein